MEKIFESFSQFLESYSGPESVVFENIKYEPISDRTFFITIDKKLYTLTFDIYSFLSDNAKKQWDDVKKALEKNKFDTGILFDPKNQYIILNGKYDIMLGNNKKVQLTQINNKGVSLNFMLNEYKLKEGDVTYADEYAD